MALIKRFVTMILALLIVCGLAIPAQAAEVVNSGTCGENLTWTLDDNGLLTISGQGDMYSWSALDVPWYSNRKSVTAVKIEDGVTSIGETAFYDCSNLTEVSIPASVTKMEGNIFKRCTSLKSVTIPQGVTSIGPAAFSNCSSLQSVVIPATVTVIGNMGFYKCSQLNNVNISGVMEFGYSVFEGCSSLTSIEIAEGVTDLSSGMFRDCTSLRDVKLPDTIIRVADYVFAGCTSLSEIDMPSRIKRWESNLFKDCISLTSIHIPAGVTHLNTVFPGCTSLTSVEIPYTVTQIWMDTFKDCTSLTSITFTGNAPTFGNKYSNSVFSGVTATAYYPENNTTWTASVRQDYGGNITWKPYNNCEHEPVLRYAEEPTYSSEGYTGDLYCTECGKLLEEGTVIPKLVMSVPAKPYKIANVVSGVHVYWKSVDGAVKYGLWRSETGKNGTYKWIANPTVPHFTDTKVESGKTYFYKVTAVNDAGEHTDKSEAIGVTYVSTPDITSRTNIASGVKLGWEKVTGATGYAIYRKSYSGTDAWERIGTISGNETFTWTDTSVKNNNGTVYKYTIRALAGSDMKTLSGCRNAGRTMARLSSQVLTSAARASATSVKCRWTTSSRVTGYEVRFIANGEVFKTFTVGNWKTGVKTFTGLKLGVTYTIQVRTYLKVDGMGFYSDWSSAKTVQMPTTDNGRNYVVNTNTGKFHFPSCSSVSDIIASNRMDYYGTRNELIDMGYSSCGRCKP